MSDVAMFNGYSHVRVLGGRLCGLHHFMFTTGLVVGIDETGYQRRYCYEHPAEALEALLAWDGYHHPDGPWIKCKGRMDDGMAVDMVNVGVAV